MRRCSAKPYEGELRYIFVSYCHKDKAQVFPIIERLVRDGYRVWYDEGIDPGSEWPEIIAHHLNGCEVCIAFITENSLNSHNCRREINFALLKKKPFISVVLEEVNMSLGMEMQLSATQSIFKYMLNGDNEFFKKLYEAKFLRTCLGEPDLSVAISTADDYKESVGELFTESNLRRYSFSDEWFTKIKSEEVKVVSVEAVKAEEIKDAEVAKRDTDNLSPNSEIHTYKAWLIREKTNEKIIIQNGCMKMGRSDIQADYVIVGNSAIGRYHAHIENMGNECKIIDNNSINKTFLNGKVLLPEKEYILNNGDSIRLANEKFTFYDERE